MVGQFHKYATKKRTEDSSSQSTMFEKHSKKISFYNIASEASFILKVLTQQKGVNFLSQLKGVNFLSQLKEVNFKSQ